MVGIRRFRAVPVAARIAMRSVFTVRDFRGTLNPSADYGYELAVKRAVTETGCRCPPRGKLAPLPPCQM